MDPAKMYAHLMVVRNRHVMDGLDTISPGVDVAYEAGRRIGIRLGMDTLLKAFTGFNDDKDRKDTDL